MEKATDSYFNIFYEKGKQKVKQLKNDKNLIFLIILFFIEQLINLYILYYLN
jgi:hypothetical protein